MSERLIREELDKISARAKTAREALMWLIRNYGNAMARRQYHQVEAPMNDVPALLGHIAALEAENERLRAVVGVARKGCQTCHVDNGHDYCRDCYHAGSGTYDALAALDEEATNETR